MKNINSWGKFLLAGALLLCFNNSCTNLDEQLYQEYDGNEFTKVVAGTPPAKLVVGVYAPLASGAFAGHNSVFSDNEVSTDEFIIPTRGGDWFDGGQWIRMHQHAYTKNEDSFNNSWNAIYKAIATCNRLIVQLPIAHPTVAAGFVAEIRALRAFYYFYICDMFGTGPLFTKFPGDIAESSAKSRAELYAFVESELLAAMPNLSTDKAATYGRMNKYAAQALLAKLYLNAQVYTGAAQPDKCIAACDAAMAGGYTMEAKYADNFIATNSASKENIFVIPFDEATLGGFQIVQMTGHYETQKSFNLTAQPWNGYCTLAEFYDSYDATDKRRDANFLAGPQFAADGTTRLQDASAESNDPDGKPLTFTKDLNEHFPGCLRQAGIRCGKYRPALGASPDLNNDFPIFRLADVKLMKAEALYRKSATDVAALGLVNEVRVRAGVLPFLPTDMTLDNLLKERGREMFAEGWRRNDIIRFGKYFKKYDKYKLLDNEAACKGIFPIPQAQIDANASLKQNDCY